MLSKRNIIFIVSGVILIVAGFIIYALIPRATILLSVAPEEFTVTINGSSRKAKIDDKITVTPGDIDLSISRDNFETYHQKFTIKNGETFEILEALTPKTTEARALLYTDKTANVMQRIENRSMKEYAKKIEAAYPIMKILPIKEKYYLITPCQSQKYPDDPDKKAFCIKYSYEEFKPLIPADVKKKGYDLSNYEVYYTYAGYDADRSGD